MRPQAVNASDAEILKAAEPWMRSEKFDAALSATAIEEER